jgi:hypothetical protein
MLQLKDLISYFETNGLADNIRENDVLFPLIESVHVLSICLVVGSIFAVDLRLLGFASIHRSVSSVTHGILPLTAGLNMAIFHGIGAKNLPQWENEARLPLPARLAGGLSILLWVAVVACGRWIGFTMPAG